MNKEIGKGLTLTLDVFKSFIFVFYILHQISLTLTLDVFKFISATLWHI